MRFSREESALVLDRRGARMKLLQTYPLRTLDIRVGSPRDLEASRRAADYLEHANFHLEAVGSGREIVARVAQFPNASIVYYSGPDVTALWTRDAQSTDRVLLLVGISTDIEVEGDASCVVITRDPRLALVAPGTGDVRITVPRPGELLYLTVPQGMIADLPLPLSSTHIPEVVDPSILLPLIAFLVHLCRTNGGDPDDLAPLPTAASEIVRSLARMLTRKESASAGLYDRAMRLIAHNFADRSLTAGRIAHHLGTAQRTLQLAFQKRGQTLAGELRRTRARAAQQARTARPDASTSAIAASVGFGSESAMFRALREMRAEASSEEVQRKNL